MEKNNQNLEEDIFLKKYVKEIALDKTKANFTNSIMDVILQQEKKSILRQEPLISKKIWFLAFGFLATCLWFLLKGKSTSTFKFPTIDLGFLSKIQMPNMFDNFSISLTMLYAIVVFSLMVFVQIFYLKNHFNKRFD